MVLSWSIRSGPVARSACTGSEVIVTMSDSQRDKDFHRLRALAKEMAASISIGGDTASIASQRNSAGYKELEKEFDQLWAKYGFKSMVMDRRRRVSTRKANQKGQKQTARAAKRSERNELRMQIIKELAEE